jgi:malonyl-CoA/methylmalonyl-CoA synthetase
VPRPGVALDGGQLIEALKSRLANYKVPKRVVVVDELPRNAMGKVQKNLLCDRFGGD